MIIINGLFWLCNWFQAENNNMNIYFLMNGNIYNYLLALQQFNWNGGSAYAIPPAPPGIVLYVPTEVGPIFAQSYINAYNTAFNQTTPGFSGNYQEALKNYRYFSPNDVDNNFIPGTFGSHEYTLGEEAIGASITQSNITILIHHLQDNASMYSGTPYLFVSAGSGGVAPGFMYLDWIIVTYGVPYVVSVS